MLSAVIAVHVVQLILQRHKNLVLMLLDCLMLGLCMGTYINERFADLLYHFFTFLVIALLSTSHFAINLKLAR